METAFPQPYSWLLRVAAFVALVGCALFTGLVISVKTELATLIFEAALFLLVLVLSRADVGNLTLAYIFTDHLCQFLKRFIFLWGAQSHPLYYSMQLLPNLFIVIAAALIFNDTIKSRVPRSALFLVLFAGISIFVSLLNYRAVPLAAGLGGLNQALIPLAALFVGMALPLNVWRKIGGAFCVLVAISVVYGLFQFFGGPTIFDQAWAAAMHDSSIEAGKVYAAMTIYGTEFRAYSYYADHTTWGLFLVIAFVGMSIAAELQAIRKRWLYVLIPLDLAGLVICETRTAWLALLGTLVVYRLINARLLRRPMLLILGVILSFAIVVTVGDYVAHHYSLGYFSNALLARYATIGTVEARTSAWRLFLRNLPSHWLMGTGFGFGSTDRNVSLSDEVFSHNMYVELLVTTGLPGLLAFLSFFYFWIKEAFWIARVSTKPVAKTALWTVSLAVGMLLTGSVQGTNFMTIYLCLFLGITSAEWRRLKSMVPAKVRFAPPAFAPAFARPRVAQLD